MPPKASIWSSPTALNSRASPNGSRPNTSQDGLYRDSGERVNGNVSPLIFRLSGGQLSRGPGGGG
mgnify:CR=1 FL=1